LRIERLAFVRVAADAERDDAREAEHGCGAEERTRARRPGATAPKRVVEQCLIHGLSREDASDWAWAVVAQARSGTDTGRENDAERRSERCGMRRCQVGSRV
jgi:hypothetical protein